VLLIPDLFLWVLKTAWLCSDQGNVALEIPYAAPNAMSNTSLIWDYQTVPQAGLSQRTIAYPRGRVLGGSSAISE